MPPHPTVTIRDNSGAWAEVIPELGGWLWRYGRELPGFGPVEALHADPATLAHYPDEMFSGCPTLFPLVSWNHLPDADHHCKWDGRVFPMPQHGLAMRRPWRETARTAEAVELQLTDDTHTRAHFPFPFRLTQRLRLTSGRLRLDLHAHNPGDTHLPLVWGIHPYLAAPLGRTGVRSNCRVWHPAGQRLTLRDRGLAYDATPLPAGWLAADGDFGQTVFLADLSPARLCLQDGLTGLETRLEWPGAPRHRFVAVWAKSPASPFLCLEPWSALPNTFSRPHAGEILPVPPGGTEQATFHLELRLSDDPPGVG